MKRFACVLLSAWAALAAFAKTTTWQGPSGANWSTGNWSDGVPESGDTVILSGTDSVNDIAELTLASLKFTGSMPISVSGNALTLTAGDASIVFVDPGRYTVAVPLVLPMTGDYTVSVAAGVTNTFSGVISGAGRPCFKGKNQSDTNVQNHWNRKTSWASVVNLKTHNTFTGGCKIEGTTLYLDENDALGGAGTVVDYTGYGPLSFAKSGDIRYSFVTLGTSPFFEFRNLPVNLYGDISNDVSTATLTFCHYNATASITDAASVNLYGRLYLPKGYIQGACGYGNVNLYQPVKVTRLDGNGGCYGGANVYNFYAQQNSATTLYNNFHGNFKCHVTNAFPNAQFSFTKYASEITLDMNGYDQTALTILAGAADAAYNSGTRIFTSPTPATLTLKPTDHSSTYFSLRDAASLTWAPTNAKTLTLTNSVFTTTGTVCVANGKLVLDSGCTCNAGMSVQLAAMASLDIRGGQTLTVRTLSVGGMPQWPGTYDFGNGKLVVTDVAPKACVWTGAGATASAADADNWGGTVPASGTPQTPTFAEGGESAEFAADATYAGLAFAGTCETFALSGAGLLTLNECGIVMEAGHVATISAALALTRKTQAVRVALGAALRTDVAVTSDVAITKAGAGTWTVGAAGSIADLSALTLEEGSLAFAGGAAALTQTLPPLTLAASSRIVLGSNVTLTLDTISQTQDETLDIVADSFDHVVAPSRTGTTAPVWLTVNGVRVRFDADGKAVEYDYGDGMDINAHGGVISDTNGVVRVAENGSGSGGVSLAGDDVSVSALAQGATENAVVSLNGGTLTAGTLTRLAGAGSLVVGAASGDGVLTAKDGALVVENRDTAADLVIRSDLAPANVSLTKTRAGTAVLPGSRSWSVIAMIEDGALAFSESKPRLELTKDGIVPTVVLTSGDSKIGIDNLSGSLAVTGEVQQDISSLAVSGGKVTVKGGVGLHIGDVTQRIPVTGELVVTNATLSVFDPAQPIVVGTTENYRCRAINPGAGGDGLLRVCAGAVVTNKLLLGSKDHVGAAYFEGGETALIAGDASLDPAGYTILAVGNNAQGYAEVGEGAKVTQFQSSRFLYGNGNATLAILGGSYVATNYPGYGNNYWAFANDSGNARLFVRGGTFRSFNIGQMLDQGTGEGVMTVTDGGIVQFYNTLHMGYGATPNNTRGTQINMLNGGRFVYAGLASNASLFPAGATNAVGERVARPVYVNFNGGEISHRYGDNYYLFDTAYGGYNCVSRVTVFENGATFQGNALTIFPFPFKAPTGGGVKSIPWATQAGFIAPPTIRIDGDGYGASAYAEFDSRSGSVTNILVTSPGCDYTHATAVVLMGTTVLAEIQCDVAANAATGALRFRGSAASHVLSNTWGEWTAGEILLDNPAAALTVYQRKDEVLSSNTVLTLCEANNVYSAWDKAGGQNTKYRLRINCVRGTAGKVTGASDGIVHAQRLALEGAGAIDFDGLVYRVEGTWEVDVADLIARQTAGEAAGQYACNIVFADEARIVLKNVDRLEELKGYVRLVKTVGNGHTITPSAHLLDDVTLPEGWKLSVGSYGIKLGRETGTVMIIR